MTRGLAVSFLALTLAVPLAAEPDRAGYFEYSPGTLPLILEAPHGGTKDAPDLTPRKGGNHARDTGTQEFARRVSELLFKQTGKRPFLLINTLKRSYFDANHNIAECETDAQRESYLGYHAMIDTAANDLLQKFESGLFIDIHSGWNDFEYDLYSGTSGNTTLPFLTRQAGLNAFEGEFSLQRQMHLRGYRIPGQGDIPKKAGPSGKVIRHFQKKDGRIDAIELEFKADRLFKDRSAIEKTAADFADSILVFLRYYGAEKQPAKTN